MTRVREWGLQDRPLNTVQFESPSHMGTLLCGLNTLRTRGWLLDVTLLAEGEAFQAHRAVLASCSDYFRAMFTDAMRESRQSEICLNGVTAAGIRLLLDYAYTSRLALNLANIQDVLSAASHVQVVAVVEACSTYLQAQLDLENCVDLATIAETYSLGQLRRRVYQLMCGRLREFSHCPDFQRLSQQQLEHLLDCDFPVDCDEGEVLRCALRWASWGDSPRRLGALPRLLARVHFAEIPSPQRDLALESLSGLDYKEWDLCYRLISEPSRQLSHLKISANPSASTVLVNSRGMELAIVKVGGFGIAGITNEITYFLRSAGKWRHLTTIPHVEQCNFGTAVLDNELYVVGGCFNQSLEENIHPFGFRYSPRSNKWSTMAPMQRERCRFSLNVLGGHLYAIGGVSEVDDAREDRDVSACERYDPATDCWESVRPLPLYCTQHAGASWGSSKLFVSGGLAHDSVHGMLHCYDSCSDSWACLQPMRMPRADHVMITVGDKLYACGGWAEDPDSGNRILVDSIDVYDVAADCWEVVTHVPTPRYHAGIVGVASKIYFVGGFRGDTLFDRATAVIECYDLDTGLWTTCDKYPREIWEHTCITLYIPRCREDMEVMTAPESPT